MPIRSFFIVLIISSLIGAGCGGGGGSGSTPSSEGLMIQASVAAPSAANLTTPLPALMKDLRIFPLRNVVEEIPGEAVVHAEDLEGNELENVDPCDMAADGTCELIGFTSEQLEEGVQIIAELANGQEIRSLVFPTEAEITAAEEGTALEESVNSESDFVHAVATDACDADLEACNGVIRNMPTLLEVAGNAIDGEDPEDPTTLDGDLEALYIAYAGEMAEGTNIHDALVAGLGGETTDFVNDVGSTVTEFDVTFTTDRMLVNADTGLETMFETYADPEDTTWETLKAESDFDPKAVIGFFEFLPPANLGDYLPADFRNVAKNIPAIDGGFQMFKIPDAAKACAQGFLKGLFEGAGDNFAKAGTAFGTLAATFPPCPPEGCQAMARTHFTENNFNPETAGLAAFNGFLAMGTGITYGNFPPADMRSKLNEQLSDRTNMQSFANGGGNDFFAGMASAGTAGNFVPANFVGEIKAPPGGSCSQDSDCLPCDSCVSSTCVAGSSKMGQSCSSNADCDGITSCMGPAGYSNCMCASVIPTGAPVIVTAGEAPTNFVPPTSGAAGAFCGTGQTACGGGTACSDSTYGVCLPSSFKKPPFAPCATGTECESNTCTSGLCGFSQTANASLKAVGEHCFSPPECASFLCSPTTGLCEAPPTTGTFGTVVTSSLKANGVSCTQPNECQSNYCCGTTTFTCSATSCATSGGTSGGRRRENGRYELFHEFGMRLAVDVCECCVYQHIKWRCTKNSRTIVHYDF